MRATPASGVRRGLRSTTEIRVLPRRVRKDGTRRRWTNRAPPLRGFNAMTQPLYATRGEAACRRREGSRRPLPKGETAYVAGEMNLHTSPTPEARLLHDAPPPERNPELGAGKHAA